RNTSTATGANKPSATGPAAMAKPSRITNKAILQNETQTTALTKVEPPPLFREARKTMITMIRTTPPMSHSSRSRARLLPTVPLPMPSPCRRRLSQHLPRAPASPARGDRAALPARDARRRHRGRRDRTGCRSDRRRRRRAPAARAASGRRARPRCATPALVLRARRTDCCANPRADRSSRAQARAVAQPLLIAIDRAELPERTHDRLELGAIVLPQRLLPLGDELGGAANIGALRHARRPVLELPLPGLGMAEVGGSAELANDRELPLHLVHVLGHEPPLAGAIAAAPDRPLRLV